MWDALCNSLPTTSEETNSVPSVLTIGLPGIFPACAKPDEIIMRALYCHLEFTSWHFLKSGRLSMHWTIPVLLVEQRGKAGEVTARSSVGS
jgi:hypothetical protein